MFLIDVFDFGVVIFFLCDFFSLFLCCNYMFGMCGLDVWYCVCDRCMDFRNMVVVELNEFVFFFGC